MKILVFSDIHANKTALKAILDEADNVDGYWCLGDIVGYGPDPNECVDIIKELPNLKCVLGNHDAGALEKIDIEVFNQEARISSIWTKSSLSDENKSYLRTLPEYCITENVMLVHGSPRNHVWEYIFDKTIAEINFPYIETQLCFVGHTHIPSCYFNINNTVSWQILRDNDLIDLKDIRAIINPGSVGQPRDRDARASYAIYDTNTFSWKQYKINYDIHAVQERIINFGLPTHHALRLLEGL